MKHCDVEDALLPFRELKWLPIRPPIASSSYTPLLGTDGDADKTPVASRHEWTSRYLDAGDGSVKLRVYKATSHPDTNVYVQGLPICSLD